jgi:amino acid transporter
MQSHGSPAPDRRLLGTWDGVSIVIGIVVGVSLYKAPALVFGSVGGPWAGMAVWVLGGALALVGALCYAELGSTYPRSGGDYAYLTLAYAPWLGFLFGWAQLVAILTGSIGALAYVFADYAVALGAGGPPAFYASVSVAALTVLNLFGVGLGRSVQNTLTLAKVAGLAAILCAGLIASGTPVAGPPAVRIGGGDLGFALILVLYAYGGWNDAAFSALGAINGLIFTGSRIYASAGADHRVFAALGRWNPRSGAPVRALLAQCGVAVGLILGVGTATGRALLDAGIGALGTGRLPWDRFGGGFDTLVAGTAPVFWLFFLATGVAVFVLRWRDPDTPRPFRVPLYPWTPLIFCASSVYMLQASVVYAREIALLGVLPLCVGVPVYLWSRRGQVQANS